MTTSFIATLSWLQHPDYREYAARPALGTHRRSGWYPISGLRPSPPVPGLAIHAARLHNPRRQTMPRIVGPTQPQGLHLAPCDCIIARPLRAPEPQLETHVPDFLPPLATLVRSLPYWLGLPVLVTLSGVLPKVWISQSSLLMMYLMAVLVCSLKVDLPALVLSALAGLLLFNYFHTAP